MTSLLFTPLRVGNLTLSHRVVMAPLTRFRANDKAVHEEIAEEYYEQRASEGGLIISEATYASDEGGGQPNAPGIWTTDQIAAWKRIVDKVHAKKGYMFSQLRADGRAAVPEYIKSKGYAFVAPSNVPIVEGDERPTPLTKEGIQKFVQAYGQAAKNAVLGSGFDGVELHNANGYLPDQFLNNRSNTRTDEYGGSVENRSRFSLEVIQAMVNAVGQKKIAIRFSPHNTFQGMGMNDKDTVETFSYLTTQLRDRFPDLAYIHVVEPRITGDSDQHEQTRSLDFIRKIWSEDRERVFFAAGGYDKHSAEKTIAEHGGAIVFGRSFVSNPDLPLRLRQDIPLTKYDRSTFYSPTGPTARKGYVDYPTAGQVKIAA